MADREEMRRVIQRLDDPVGLVNWNIEKLERDELCVRVEMMDWAGARSASASGR